MDCIDRMTKNFCELSATPPPQQLSCHCCGTVQFKALHEHVLTTKQPDPSLEEILTNSRLLTEPEVLLPFSQSPAR
jgi:hypothetical protein